MCGAAATNESGRGVLGRHHRGRTCVTCQPHDSFLMATACVYVCIYARSGVVQSGQTKAIVRYASDAAALLWNTIEHYRTCGYRSISIRGAVNVSSLVALRSGKSCYGLGPLACLFLAVSVC